MNIAGLQTALSNAWHLMLPYSHPDQWFMLVGIHAMGLAVTLILIGIMIAAVNWCLRGMLGRYGARAGAWISRTYMRYLVLPLAGLVVFIALLPYFWPILVLLVVAWLLPRLIRLLVNQGQPQQNRRPRRQNQNRGRRAPQRGRP